ncbi:MAG TPA: BON domain-containing protein [Chloroflexota bacterium]|nr:BON domain-containing protein [Chloroflexota bacterium]
MHRDFERDDPRRRYRRDDDPRDDPRERYGNEEDPWSREYRRAYAEDDLPRRMHDDRPYNRPGYEPEFGRPGGRENVRDDRRRREDRFQSFDQSYAGDPYGFDWEQPPGQQDRFSGYRRRDDRWQGGYYGQGRRFSGRPFEPEGHGGRTERYGQPSYGRAASPYDEGDIGSWYGGDTGMGNPGMSVSGSQQYGTPPASQFWRRYGARIDMGWGQPRGQFTGHGPRGYRRSDERIHEDACELLTRHGEIDAREMDVEVHGSTVILRGTVDSGRTRRLAEELVEEIPGVQDVQNELRVSRQTRYGTRDSEAMVDSGTFADDRGGFRESGVPAYGVGVAVTSGISTRSGPGGPGAGAGAGPSQHGNRWQIRETMDVVGSDGAPVGTVKSVHGTDFHVDRPTGRDLFVPFSAVRTVDGERVMLSVRASEVDDQRWPTPGLTGSNEGSVTR